jgi:hypothetical protein
LPWQMMDAPRARAAYCMIALPSRFIASLSRIWPCSHFHRCICPELLSAYLGLKPVSQPACLCQEDCDRIDLLSRVWEQCFHPRKVGI